MTMIKAVTVEPAPNGFSGLTISIGAEGHQMMSPLTPVEWQALKRAGDEALGVVAPGPSALADRIENEQGAPINLLGICSEGREEDVFGAGYVRGRADAARMVRETGPTVPQAGVARLIDLVIKHERTCLGACGCSICLWVRGEGRDSGLLAAPGEGER